ncbi:MAG: glycosyltransferase [Acidobacteriaceae bacterium]|nr:glycosyltransferase [Acidobacteriaceae bacterium]
MNKRRCLIFVVAYHAETTIENVIRRIPSRLAEEYEVEVLIIDDSSQDRTFEKSHKLATASDIPFNIRVLCNPVNQGYGGNQKLGYHYAIENGYDFVALLHGDGQYAPECLPDLLAPVARGEAAAVFGSRMMVPSAALHGGMPVYKYAGNRILTWIQNLVLRSHLSEFHSGYRVYSVAGLRAIPFEYNSNGFPFDTEIIIQLMIARLPILELPIPTYYGDEICRVNGIQYAVAVMLTTLHAKAQELSLFYDRKYDCAPTSLSQYSSKFSFDSPHSFALNIIPHNSRVIDLGCASGYMGIELRRRRGCYVTGVDAVLLQEGQLDQFYIRNLNDGLDGIPVEEHDFVLLLDVIEHLEAPEAFLGRLRDRLALNPRSELIISTGNVAFIVTRLMLFFGNFNYGKRGILDLTHTRLFTMSSLARALEQSGFVIKEIKTVPAPFPLALGNNVISKLLLNANAVLKSILPGMFGYQVILRAHVRPTVRSLLQDAYRESDARREFLAMTAASAT